MVVVEWKMIKMVKNWWRGIGCVMRRMIREMIKMGKMKFVIWMVLIICEGNYIVMFFRYNSK